MEFHKLLARRRLGVKSKLQFATFRCRLCLPANLLRRRFERTQAADLFHYPFRVELILQAFQSPINRLSFTDNNFRHKTFFRDALAGYEGNIVAAVS